MNSNNKNIQEAISKILFVLQEKGLSEISLKNYRYPYNVFLKYLEDNGISEINENVCLDYIEFKNGRRLDSLWCTVSDTSINRRLRPLHLLLQYLNSGTISLDTRPKTPNFQCPEHFREVYDDFCLNLSESGLASATRYSILKYVGWFLEFIADDMDSIDSLKTEQLDMFLAQYADNTLKYRGSILYALKKFLVFLYQKGYCTRDYTEVLLPLRIPRCGCVPHTWKKEELVKVLNAVDRESPTGKRDYAIFLLAIQTGLRAGDIRNLRLKDIDWNSHTLRLIMGKTSQPIELPLLENTGWAIIDYLKNGRPECDSDNIFLRHHFPVGPIGSTSTLDRSLSAYIKKAGIEIRPGEAHGMHTLRSSLAKNMLYSGAELPVISQTLGHQDERTTVGNYLRLDVEGLRACSLDLEWEGDNNEEL